MKFVISMHVKPENDFIRAEFLSMIDAVFGKIGGLISMIGGIVFLGIFGILFNQPGGRR